MELELCEMLNCTPKELGDKRIKEPQGIEFLERAILNRYKEKEKAYKEASKGAKKPKRGSIRRR
jgi:hypothetical protein